jgi:hypothetical protein
MQNTSHAVMAQRAEPHDSLDDFPTPPWAVRAFCEVLSPHPAATVWEPAANRGFMVKGLRDFFAEVYASDVQDYGAGFPVHDFLMPGPPLFHADWVITNPPFRLAAEFVERGLRVARCGVAVIVRSVWAEGAGRYERLFRDNPPAWIMQHVERVPMVRGRYDPKASTATGYSWFVWHRDAKGRAPEFRWIPPSRAGFYKEGDEDLTPP